MTFCQSVSVCFSKYATFTGRASRAEFWWFFLFNMLASVCLFTLVAAFAGSETGDSVWWVYYLAILSPSMAVGARRLHDMGHSGWWQLLHLTGIGSLILFIWMIFPGKPEANRFGQPVVSQDESTGQVSFCQAVSVCLSKHEAFSGRASRAEFWWFVLFNILMSVALVGLVRQFAGPEAGSSMWMIYAVIIFMPLLAVGVRRLHDMGHSGWWQLLHLTGLGSLILFIWMIFPGNPDANRFGQPVMSQDS